MLNNGVGAYHWDQDGVRPGGMTLIVDIIPHANTGRHRHNGVVTCLDHQVYVFHVDDIAIVL